MGEPACSNGATIVRTSNDGIEMPRKPALVHRHQSEDRARVAQIVLPTTNGRYSRYTVLSRPLVQRADANGRLSNNEDDTTEQPIQTNDHTG